MSYSSQSHQPAAQATQFTLPPALPPNAQKHLLPITLPQGSCFALIIDNFLTPAECTSLLSAAEAKGPWELAMVNIGYGRQKVLTDVRNCERIIFDTEEISEQLFERLKPTLSEFEIDHIGPRESEKGKRWTGLRSACTGEEWRMTRLNERLRFLKYSEGEYFRPHTDGTYHTPSGSERSFLTFHVYLGPNGEDCKGGATRFFFRDNEDSWNDVEPVQGRVLVFQHAHLMHSGEEMESGTKYTVRSDVMYERVPKEEDGW
ncbi:hypothetical protein FPQ18DRAFT_358659 [Pyronema domesticum]|nr:hypothetical protein FPQ18DRAFT_358659 [Pyronema domesticum]